MGPVFTIGHSTRPIEDFVRLLRSQGVTRVALARDERIALMCAEAVPWRCHRSLIADALLARGIEVLEISSETRARPHALTPFARVDGTDITYPGIEE